MKRLALAALVATASLGCGKKYLVVGSESLVTRPAAAVASPDEVFGRQVRVRVHETEFFGELLACDASNAYLQINTTIGNPYAVIPWRDIDEATAKMGTDSRPYFITWAIVGGLSTISHGFFLVISLPIWAAVGAGSTVWARSYDFVSGHCPELRPYARYPQGLPPLMQPRFTPLVPVPVGLPGYPPPGYYPPPPGYPPYAPPPSAPPKRASAIHADPAASRDAVIGCAS